jgi:hypothetical protein
MITQRWEACCTAGFRSSLGQLRVKTGKSRSEQLFSDLPPEADLTADIVDVSNVPTPDSCTAVNSLSYSITSSARSRNDSGTRSPIAFAVAKLMISSNLVGCSTGRSAGFAPLKILST